MNCIQRTLESTLMLEKGMMKTTQQALLDDLPTVNGNGGGSGEESFVDDLLDFSNGFDEGEEKEIEEQEQNRKDCSVSPNQNEETDKNNNNSDPITRSSSAIEDLSSIPCTELSMPAEDMENLKWLSNFLEDSFSEHPLNCPIGKLPEKQKEDVSVQEIGFQAKPCFTTRIQTKVRTKRQRAGWHVWSLGSQSPSPSAESSLTSSSSLSSSATSFSFSLPPKPWLTDRSPSQAAESVIKMRPEEKKRKAETEASSEGGAAQPRRCTHCGAQKTPQWRAGPLGAKTFCNACGVRYKSGRLFPEYRPACSPTFSRELHSNNHRKVLELRRNKESGEDLAPPCSEFLRN